MTHSSKGRRLFLSILGIGLAVGFGLLMGKYLTVDDRSFSQAAVHDAGIIRLPSSRALPALQLTSTRNTVQDTQALTGQWSLVFFGYTFCPDICPTTLAELRKLNKLLPEDIKSNLQILMVSVDPQRDTVDQLQQYLQYFDPSFIGLTGELSDIQTLSNALSIPFIPGDTSQPHYTVDHSGNLAIIQPDGRQFGFVRAPLEIEKLAAQLPKIMNQ
ncbi:MAG TPA: SCO family protein [Thiopseudomonas sp.]|nr:SCO family protein [Thiopseudomonas sp.]